MNPNEILKYCIGLSTTELIKYARENYKIVFDYVKTIVVENKAQILINGSLVTCISVDGRFTKEEWEFIDKVAEGYAPRTYRESLPNMQVFYRDSAEVADVTTDFISKLPQNIKEAQIKLCLAVASVDKNIAQKEADLLNRILGVF